MFSDTLAAFLLKIIVLRRLITNTIIFEEGNLRITIRDGGNNKDLYVQKYDPNYDFQDGWYDVDAVDISFWNRK